MNADQQRADKLLNLLVFAPLSFYAARGEKPPTLVSLIAVAYTGYTFLRDADWLRQDIAQRGLLPGVQSPPREQVAGIPDFAELRRYRVNRSA